MFNKFIKYLKDNIIDKNNNIPSLKKESDYIIIEDKDNDYYNKKIYELTINFDDSTIYQKKISQQTADYIYNSMQLEKSDFINLKTDKEFGFIKKENIKSIHVGKIFTTKNK